MAVHILIAFYLWYDERWCDDLYMLRCGLFTLYEYIFKFWLSIKNF